MFVPYRVRAYLALVEMGQGRPGKTRREVEKSPSSLESHDPITPPVAPLGISHMIEPELIDYSRNAYHGPGEIKVFRT